ncbi:hypothetical protein HH310_22215 [Actinoplanes sp. TBRC 11911]|uniref:hypothetical protein n=1 Tax=Actinoplanes sp. TBRC 11911 TaxID=2729386 RepID=UPI00145F0F94|nr:hypothetical protein [Actinoplanes sp. TBRC 11911]NMO53882.1 hypothetical protein [Actinoplanes sp. TBRC 11911]
MNYGIYFDSATSADAVREALQTVYGIAPSLVYVGPYENLAGHPGPDPVALVVPAGGQFGHELSAGDRLAELTGQNELELARSLCRVAGCRALVDDGSPAPDYWFLVAEDGSYGRVETDADADGLTVRHALEPIAGAPDLIVQPPPDWARTW